MVVWDNGVGNRANDIFDIFDKAELCNYADDNNILAVGDRLLELKNILKQETTVLLEWFDKNHLVANPGKFHLRTTVPFVTAHPEIFHCTHHPVIPEPNLYFPFCSIFNALSKRVSK